MSAGEWPSDLSDRHIGRLKQRCRILMLLDAAERAGSTPLSSSRLHAFAYLADVLSPVWGLEPFDPKVYKSEDGPHYSDLQDELDHLVVLGLVRATKLDYMPREDGGARIRGFYSLDFESSHLLGLLADLGALGVEDAVDSRDHQLHGFLVELAGALATLPDDQIDRAARVDVTYRLGGHLYSVIDFSEWVEDPLMANPTWRVAERFETFLPKEVRIAPSEKLYLYAAYLGRAMNVA